jgi:hypothetical protein
MEKPKLYYELADRILPSKNWGDCVRILFPRCKHGPILHRPGQLNELKRLELKLGMPLPPDLLSFYRFSNGLAYYGRDLIYTLEQLISLNLSMRGLEINMPVDHLLFFGGTGDGDEYAFGRRVDGEYHSSVFAWGHETDERTAYEGSLKWYLVRWSVDFKTQPHLRRV